MLDQHEASAPLRPCFTVTSRMAENPADGLIHPQRRMERETSARPHPARQRHRRQEASTRRMAIRAQHRLPSRRQEVQPVPQRRHASPAAGAGSSRSSVADKAAIGNRVTWSCSVSCRADPRPQVIDIQFGHASNSFAAARARPAPSYAISAHNRYKPSGRAALDLRRSQMRRDTTIRRQQRAKRLTLQERILRRVVHRVMRMLPPDRGAKVQHDRLGHDQPAAQIQVGPHPRRVQPQAEHDLVQPAEHVAGRDARRCSAVSIIRLVVRSASCSVIVASSANGTWQRMSAAERR